VFKVFFGCPEENEGVGEQPQQKAF